MKASDTSSTKGRVDSDSLSWRWTGLAVVACSGLLAWFTRIGADYDWLVAVGNHIRVTGAVPDHVPYATAPSSGWRDVPVLAQLAASWAQPAGDIFIVFVHILLVTLSFVVLARTARTDGASDRSTAWTTTAVFVGGVSALAVVRLQTFSFLPFAFLIALVVAEHQRLTKKIWWAPVLIAVWGNLHGAVLLGVCVLGAYLLLGRLRDRPLETIAVGALSLGALFINPQGWHTPTYYLTVLDNEAAARGEGLWGRPELAEPLDAVMVLSIVALGLALVRCRRAAWVYVVILGLGVATAIASRNGIWLLMVLGAFAPPGRDATATAMVAAHRRSPLVSVALATALVLPLLSLRQIPLHGVDPALVHAVKRASAERVVLAPSPLAETLAASGVTVWLTNPIDAFDKQDQGAYIDFLSGERGMELAVAGSDVVVTEDGSAAADRMADEDGFVRMICSQGWTCYVRR